MFVQGNNIENSATDLGKKAETIEEYFEKETKNPFPSMKKAHKKFD